MSPARFTPARRLALARLGLSSAAALYWPALRAAEPAYPTRTIKILVPVGAGSGLDSRAREVAQGLADILAQPVLIENRPGAGGIVGMGQFAKAAPDGYTLAISSIGVVSYYPWLYRKLPYAPADFQPVSLLATGPSSIYASPALPARSLEGLVTLARSKPGALSFASPGLGTFQHLAGEWFRKAAGVDLLHVPYKDYGQIITDLEAGRVSLLFDSTGAVLPHVQAGKLRAFAITGDQRLGTLPDVPTFAEAGLPSYTPGINYGLFTPAGTPATTVAVLAAACARVQQGAALREVLARFGFRSQGSTPTEFAAYIDSESARWRDLLQTLGLQLDQG